MDIPNEIIFGFNPPPIVHLNARRLKIKNPRCVNRCNVVLDALCEKEQIYYRVDHSYQTSSDPLSEYQQRQYEAIDL